VSNYFPAQPTKEMTPQVSWAHAAYTQLALGRYGKMYGNMQNIYSAR